MSTDSPLHLPRRKRARWASPGPDLETLAALEKAAEEEEARKFAQPGPVRGYPPDVVVVHGDPEETQKQLQAAQEQVNELRHSDERRPPFPRRRPRRSV